MASDSFMEKLRMFLGLQTPPPRNDFRNPIWGSDDDDDGDELYSRQNFDSYDVDIHEEITKQMHDMLRSFGGILGDMKSFFQHDQFDSLVGLNELPAPVDPENYNSNSIREHYLKPGYNIKIEQPKEDIDLDGKISSQEISGLLKKNEGQSSMPIKIFDGSLVPGRSYCQTIITTSVTKPDGTIETRRIVKSGNDVVEETTTSTGPDSRNPHNPGLTPISSTRIILSDLISLFKNFY